MNTHLPKRVIQALLIATTSLSAQAADRWVDDTYSGGETVFSSGHIQVLLVGKRGIGINVKNETSLSKPQGTIRIDDGTTEEIKLKHLGLSTYAIEGSERLIEKVANAKKFEIQYNRCWGYTNGCTFTYNGEIKKTTWEFDVPLSEQYKDYKEKIR